MASKVIRKPLGNFFIKKALQVRLIMKVVAAALLSVAVSAASLILVYYMKYQTIVIYTWDQDDNVLQKGHIIELILPTLIISSVVGLIVAFGIGLYASRKYAVPVYKIEQWTSMLLRGQMTAILKFREEEEMKDLSVRCNELGTHIRGVLMDIQNKVKVMQDAGVQSKELDAIAARLGAMELTNEPVEVKTVNLERVVAPQK
jgi:signal transduction histidine kinase